jgi:predicted dehydrogenase
LPTAYRLWPIMRMKKTLQIGCIGLGQINRVHMQGWAASPYAEVIAGCSRSDATRIVWGQEFGVTALYSDASDLLARSDIDAVDICTPTASHTALVIAALEAGKHVLCEKPLAVTPPEIERIIDAQQASGKQVMTGQHYRYFGTAQALKTEIDQGALGDIYHARAWMLRRNAFIPTSTFVYQSEAGGGAGLDIGVHILDLAVWMMGQPKAVRVSGATTRALSSRHPVFSEWHSGEYPKDADVDELTVALIHFANGATLSLEVSWMLHHDTQGENPKLWLYGTAGGVEWPQNVLLSSDYQNKTLHRRLINSKPDPLPAQALACIDFARCIIEGKPCPITPQESLAVARILEAIYDSARQGEEIRLR